LLYGSFFGGTGSDTAVDLSIGPGGSLVVGGGTGSHDLPTTAGTFDPVGNVAPCSLVPWAWCPTQSVWACTPTDAYVAAFDPTGRSLLYASYFGGSGMETTTAFVEDDLGRLHLGGRTISTDHPVTIDAYDPTLQGTEGWLATLSAGAASLVYGTYLGGTDSGAGGLLPDDVAALAADAAGRVLVGGSTTAADFPVTPDALDGSLGGTSDAFLAIIDLACQGTLEFYGTGLAGTGGFVPTFHGSGCPTPGGTTDLFVTQGIGAAFGGLFYTLTGKASIPALGGTLLLAPPFQAVTMTLGGAPGVAGAGSLAVPVNVPPNPAIVGFRIDVQFLFFDAGAPYGVSMTNGIEMILG
jgi:hypothetical protein